MLKRLAAGIAIGVWSLVSVAQSATLTVDAIGGIFSNITSTNPSKGALTGAGTGNIAWGTPWTAADKRSSYTFAGTPTSSSTTGSFLIGSYTHFNGTIAASSDRLLGTTLRVGATGLAGSIAYSIMSSFFLTHNETLNNPACPVGQNPCGDLVTITNTSKGSVTLQDGNSIYALIIDGFVASLGGPIVNAFLTAENQSRTLYLQASLTVTQLPPPPPPIPLPAAGVAMATGLVALAALRRRRKG